MNYVINGMSRYFLRQSLGILLIRIALGLLFFVHGWMKVHNMDGTVTMFVHLGFPGWVGYFIAYLELIGGAALALGILTRVFAFLFGIEMLVAVLISPLSRALGGTELLLSMASFGVALTGSGRLSLLPFECAACGGMLCNSDDPACPKRAA